MLSYSIATMLCFDVHAGCVWMTQIHCFFVPLGFSQVTLSLGVLDTFSCLEVRNCFDTSTGSVDRSILLNSKKGVS